MLLCWPHSQAHHTRIVKGQRAKYLFSHEHDVRNQQRPKTTICNNFTFSTCCVIFAPHQLDMSFWAPWYAHVKLRYQALSTLQLPCLRMFGISQGSRGYVAPVSAHIQLYTVEHLQGYYTCCDSTSNWSHCVQVEIELLPYKINLAC